MIMNSLLPLQLTMTQLTAHIRKANQIILHTKPYKIDEEFGFEYFVAQVREVYLVHLFPQSWIVHLDQSYVGTREP